MYSRREMEDLEKLASSVPSLGGSSSLPIAQVEPNEEKVCPAQPHDSLAAGDQDTIYVYPWKGILANIKTSFNEQEKRYAGESGSKLREELASKMLNPYKVQPLWISGFGHTGFAIVDFGKDWEGYRNATNFEKHFEVNQCGKRDYDVAALQTGDKLYGWVAKKEDYNSGTVVGDHLRKQGDLKSVSDVEAEDQRKALLLITDLKHTLETKDSRIQETERIYKEITISLQERMRERDEMINAHNEKMSRMQQASHDYTASIYQDHEKTSQYLEAKREEFDKVQVLNKAERIQKATEEQNKADEAMMKLAEQHKREKDELREKVCELQQMIDAEEAFELEIERMRGSLEVMKLMEEIDAKEEVALELEIEHMSGDLEVARLAGEMLKTSLFIF